MFNNNLNAIACSIEWRKNTISYTVVGPYTTAYTCFRPENKEV